ncbi:hypothetical protein AAFF_G00359350 [Aldrovandia affinis]|uniref:Uncharacterized protein n=1 Tax=Aldrovandia affinis TaxID=143900 RepID=A0AAD7WNZ4_9TELE|nr:hypothetical protein AAFF_G00359350 [Aldrovandia affinis]
MTRSFWEEECHTRLSARPPSEGWRPSAHLLVICGCDLTERYYATHLFLSACHARPGWRGHVREPSPALRAVVIPTERFSSRERGRLRPDRWADCGAACLP